MTETWIWITILVVILVGVGAMWRFSRSIERLRSATHIAGNIRVSYSEPESKSYPYREDS